VIPPGDATGDAAGGGALAGLRVVEVAGVGPAPFCAMLLADMGADVICVDRIDRVGDRPYLGRGRRSVAADLKDEQGVGVLLRLADRADVLIEGYRPGVAERLGFGPATCLERNPGLVYGRMTGFGQSGPWCGLAGHDIDYIALSGVLGTLGREGEPPSPPLNLVADFGGGGMLLAFGILCALAERSRSGLGQVVDAAMIDGAGLLMTLIYEMQARGDWTDRRGANLLDGGAYFYGAYETADGKWIAVGAVEPQFHAGFIEALELSGEELPDQWDRTRWAEMRDRVAAVVRGRTRDEWEERLARADACAAPVLGLHEVPGHPHMQARAGFVDDGGAMVPAPAPRLSRTPATLGRPAPSPGEDTSQVLAEHGYGDDEIERLRARGVVAW